WRGGGVIHGPQARVRELGISKELRKQVFSTLLSKFLDQSRIVSLDWVPTAGIPKTKDAYALLKNAGLHNTKNIFFVMPGDDDVRSSFSNIQNLQVVYFDQPNAFDLAQADHWLF